MENSCASSIEVSVSTGKVTVQNVECDGELNVKISTGKTKIGDVMCGTLYSDGSTGDLIMYNVISVGKLSIIRSTGDVKFENCDAAEVYMETDTGDVTGNFLSDKIFLTNTATGKTEVPKSITGGRCEVNTDTGDIKISIKQK